MGDFTADPILEAEEVMKRLEERIERLEEIVEKIGTVLNSHTNDNSIHRSPMYGGNPFYIFIDNNEKILEDLGFNITRFKK